MPLFKVPLDFCLYFVQLAGPCVVYLIVVDISDRLRSLNCQKTTVLMDWLVPGIM